MSTEAIDYSAVLADLESRRAALDAAITHLRMFLAGQGGNVSGGGTQASGGVPIPTGEVPAGAFLGKSIPDAVKLYLQIMKRKATTREIAEALRRGGMESTSANFQGIVHAVINRYWKSGGDIIKLDKSTWGLAAWYPAGVRATAQEKHPGGKKRGRPKSKVSRAPKQPEAPATGPSKPGLEQRIETLLVSDKGKSFTLAEIAAALGIKTHGLALALGRMEKKDKATKTTAGGYRAFGGGTQKPPLATTGRGEG